MLTLLTYTLYGKEVDPNDASALFGILFLAVIGVVYFLPSIIAARRYHPNGAPIYVVNLFLGWTLIGWVIALAWSLTAIPQPPKEAE